MRIKTPNTILFILLFFLAGKLFAQQDSLDRKRSILGFPLAFYSPDTRWGVGAAGIYNFYIDQHDSISPSSQIQLGFAFTQNKQLLLYAPFNLFWNERKWQVYGQIGYNKYSYLFYGVGNENTGGYRESFEVDFPRFRLNLLRKIAPNLYGGLRFWYENYNLTKLKEGGLLDSGGIAGSAGGVTSGPGVILNYDSRDNVYYAHNGMYVEAVYQSSNETFGSDYVFDRYRLDIRGYFGLFKNHFLALQGFLDVNMGNPPFSQMAMLGGIKRMRGLREGRYRDKTMVLLQSEYRLKIWKALHGAVFFNSGIVDAELSHLSVNNLRTSYGAGIRYMFDVEKRVNIRLDAAFGEGGNAFYFTIGEAF